MAQESSLPVEREDKDDNNSTGTTFAWVAAFLINASFVALIAWGTVSNWPVGFTVSAIYIAILIAASLFLKRRNGGKNTVLTSLLFLLSIVAIAVTGSFLPLNLIECAKFPGSDYYTLSDGSWVTDTSSLSSDVQNWWSNNNNGRPNKFQSVSYVYLPNNDITLFRGTGSLDGGDESLWKVSSGNEPEVISDTQHPRDFILVKNSSTACFVNNLQAIVCTTDGEDLQTILREEGDKLQSPRDLYYSDDLVWFRANPPFYTGIYSDVLYSVNVSNATDVKLYSRQQESHEGEDDNGDTNGNSCDRNRTTRILFVSLLFVSAVPCLISAFILHRRYQIPSVPFGGYLGLTWFVVCIIFIIDPGFDNLFDFFRWWFVLTSGPWLIVLTFAHLTNRMTKESLAWGLNLSGLVYIVGMFIILKVFDDLIVGGGDTFWRWVVLTLVGIIPLIALSVITGQILLMVLASIGLMIDVWRLTSYVTEIVGLSDSAPVQFIVLGLSGLALGFFGYFLSKYQTLLQATVGKWSEAYLGRWRLEGDDEEEREREDEEDDTAEVKSVGRNAMDEEQASQGNLMLVESNDLSHEVRRV